VLCSQCTYASGAVMPGAQYRQAVQYSCEQDHDTVLVDIRSGRSDSHAQVDWYPWGQEAFDKAKQEDKPIFLSVGYSTCHW